VTYCNICTIFVHFFSYFLSFAFMQVSLLMTFFSLWQMSSESEVFVGFANGASRHTRRLSSAAWVIFTPQG
jgi:hypothetical protein